MMMMCWSSTALLFAIEKHDILVVEMIELEQDNEGTVLPCIGVISDEMAFKLLIILMKTLNKLHDVTHIYKFLFNHMYPCKYRIKY